MSIPKVYVDYMGSGIININFDPVVKLWRFPHNNQDEIISSLYKDITTRYVYRALDSSLKAEMEAFISSKLKDLQYSEQVLFPTEVVVEFEKW